MSALVAPKLVNAWEAFIAHDTRSWAWGLGELDGFGKRGARGGWGLGLEIALVRTPAGVFNTLVDDDTRRRRQDLYPSLWGGGGVESLRSANRSVLAATELHHTLSSGRTTRPQKHTPVSTYGNFWGWVGGIVGLPREQRHRRLSVGTRHPRRGTCASTSCTDAVWEVPLGLVLRRMGGV
jgi:hypothetical protein